MLEAGSRGTSEAALCVFDNGLNRVRFDQDELYRCHLRLGNWPWMRHLHVPVRMADPRSASIGESRGRWLCRVFHLPAPDLQYVVRDSAGHHLGTCDWGWPEHGLLGEFDGRIKYGRLLRAGQELG